MRCKDASHPQTNVKPGEPPRKRRRVEDPGAEPRFVDLSRDESSPRMGDFTMDMDWSMGVENHRE